MNEGLFIKELALNFGVMVTFIYLASAIARSFPRADTVRRSTALVAMAIVSGWVTMMLAVRIGVLTFDLRFLPGVIVAFYARRPWIIALVFALIAPARFYHGFNLPALYGALIMALIGVVMAAVNPWVSRKNWSDHLKIAFYVMVAVGINMLWMLLQHKFLAVNFSDIHIRAIIPIQFVSTAALCFVATLIFRDIEKEQAKQTLLMEEAFKDPLTELHNRRHFSGYFELLKQRNGLPISVAYLDIDFFKNINDRYGHAMGDVVLKEVGARIAQQIRPCDYCARLGGEEFVVILLDCLREQALQIAERVRKAIEETDFYQVEAGLRVTVSIGVATSDRIEDVMIQQADDALYKAKRSGRNRVVHSSDDALLGQRVESKPGSVQLAVPPDVPASAVSSLQPGRG